MLRPPSYGATLDTVDLAPAKKISGVVAVRDGEFAGCAAPTKLAARQAVAAMAASAKWNTKEHPSSTQLFEYLKEHAQNRGEQSTVQGGSKRLKATYHAAYIQHAPMEPRSP